MESPLRLPDYQNKYGQGFYGEFDFVDGNFGGVNDGADESWGPKMDGGHRLHHGPRDSVGHTLRHVASVQSVLRRGPVVPAPNNVRDFWNTGLIINANIAVARAQRAQSTSALRARWEMRIYISCSTKADVAAPRWRAPRQCSH